MLQDLLKSYIDPLKIGLKEQPEHCLHVEAEWDGNTWYINRKCICKFVDIQKNKQVFRIKQSKQCRTTCF